MHLLWRVFGRHSPWPRRFLGWCARALGVRARIIGERVEGAALFASNHLSWLDILLVGGATGASFVSKDSVRNWPVAGRLATMVGTIYITAEDRRAAGAQAERIREALERGTSVAFFPEGKIENGAFLPFRPALFGAVTASERKIPVQPVALDFGDNAKRLVWRKGTHAGWHAWDLAGDPGVKDVTIQLLDPVFAGPDDHRKELAYKSEISVARALGREPASVPA
ncbi:MAG: lysophospholipid acyltransferase family protein [Parasphingopyxis sp.]